MAKLDLNIQDLTVGKCVQLREAGILTDLVQLMHKNTTDKDLITIPINDYLAGLPSRQKASMIFREIVEKTVTDNSELDDLDIIEDCRFFVDTLFQDPNRYSLEVLWEVFRDESLTLWCLGPVLCIDDSDIGLGGLPALIEFLMAYYRFHGRDCAEFQCSNFFIQALELVIKSLPYSSTCFSTMLSRSTSFMSMIVTMLKKSLSSTDSFEHALKILEICEETILENPAAIRSSQLFEIILTIVMEFAVHPHDYDFDAINLVLRVLKTMTNEPEVAESLLYIHGAIDSVMHLFVTYSAYYFLPFYITSSNTHLQSSEAFGLFAAVSGIMANIVEFVGDEPGVCRRIRENNICSIIAQVIRSNYMADNECEEACEVDVFPEIFRIMWHVTRDSDADRNQFSELLNSIDNFKEYAECLSWGYCTF